MILGNSLTVVAGGTLSGGNVLLNSTKGSQVLQFTVRAACHSLTAD